MKPSAAHASSYLRRERLENTATIPAQHKPRISSDMDADDGRSVSREPRRNLVIQSSFEEFCQNGIAEKMPYSLRKAAANTSHTVTCSCI
jgi:hypothetical protein